MPTYVYKFVDTGETIEVQQAFTDDTLSEYTHPDSGEMLPVKKVFQPVGVTFKGSGFFKTDNRGKSSAASSGSESGSNGSTSSDSSGSSGSSGSESSGTKSDTKSTSDSSSSSGSSSSKKASASSGSD